MKFWQFILLIILACSCKEEVNNKYQVTTESVGNLKKSSLTRDIELIFDQDSIVKDTTSINLVNNAKRLKIFEKGGKLLLTLTPSSDSIPQIENIRFEDARFVTEKGLTTKSTFKDIKEAYSIKKIITTMNNVLVLLKESDVYFIISKDQLPSNLQYAVNKDIEAVQIPDKATIKYMMMGWD